MKYYGVRYAKNCDPSDLFVTYFTSSRHVKKYIQECGNPDIVEVRKTFTDPDSVKKALLHEHIVLRRLRASERTDYLNKTDNKAIAPENRGRSPFDTTVYEFRHNNGTVEQCTRHELMKRYNLKEAGLSMLITNKRPRYKGWRMPWSPPDEELALKKQQSLENVRKLIHAPGRQEARIRGQNKSETKEKRRKNVENGTNPFAGPNSISKIPWTCEHCSKQGKGTNNYTRWHKDGKCLNK